MAWLERLTGWPWNSPSKVREQCVTKAPRLHSLANGRSWLCVELETMKLRSTQGVLNAERTKNTSLFLTLLGGKSFGNDFA